MRTITITGRTLYTPLDLLRMIMMRAFVAAFSVVLRCRESLNGYRLYETLLTELYRNSELASVACALHSSN